MGYLASWGVRTKGTRIANLPAAQLTHVNYAFGRIADDGTLTLSDPCLDIGQCASPDSLVNDGGNFAELRRLRKTNPHLRLLLAVGGWSGSGKFSDVAVSPESRQKFVASALELAIRRTGMLFDGVDIDWEYPVRGGMAGNSRRPEDRENFTELLREFRRQLDRQGAHDHRRYDLTIATIAGPWVTAQMQLDTVAAIVDWINVMSYDYHSGSPMAHFNAPLRSPADDPTPGLSIENSVQSYLAAGVPAAKIVVGVPFYGRVYGGVSPVNDGLFQPATAPIPEEWRTGTDYRSLVQRRPDTSGFRQFRHPEARVPWYYNPATGTFITYDDLQSIGEKADFVRTRRLGGVMIWELGGDDGTLVPLIHERLRR